MCPFEHDIKVVKILESNIENDRVMSLCSHGFDIELGFKHV